MPLVRGRPSAATTQASPSTTSPVQSRSRQLPPYEPPSHPLTPAAQRSLASLPSTSTANSNSTSIPSKLKNHFKAASEALGEVTDNINELATVQRRKAERQKQRARGKPTSSGAGEDEENEEPMDEDGGGGGAEASAVGKKVDVLTAEIEEKVRDLIDLQARMDAREKSLKEAIAMTEQGGGSSTTFGRGTQSTLGASQFRKQLPGEFAEADEENDDAEQEGSNGTIDGYAGPGVPTLIGNRMRDWEQKYGAMGMREKYANHNDYISFKSSLHYAQHAGEDPPPPVPHSSTWFRSSSSGPGGSQPTLNRHESGSADDEDPDSDLEAVTANINIKCPITLLPMRNPVRSTKCPHNFERDAIEDMIRRSPTRVGGSGRRGINDGIQAVGCPVCSTVSITRGVFANHLTLDDGC